MARIGNAMVLPKSVFSAAVILASLTAGIVSAQTMSNKELSYRFVSTCLSAANDVEKLHALIADDQSVPKSQTAFLRAYGTSIHSYIDGTTEIAVRDDTCTLYAPIERVLEGQIQEIVAHLEPITPRARVRIIEGLGLAEIDTDFGKIVISRSNLVFTPGVSVAIYWP